MRAYAGLRTNRRDLALRAWLYRIAHNRCIDELRRPQAIAVEAVDELGESRHADPHLRAEQREALRRLIADVQRLPDQQRSALLMRELGGMPYADLSGALGVSVPAVKSLLVRARVGLVQANEARDTDCSAIREDLIVAHDRGVRASGRARRHMRDCSQCRRFRREVHGVSRRFALLVPALGPLGIAAKLLGIGSLSGGSAAAGSSTGAAAGSTAAAAGSTGAAAGSTAAVAGRGRGDRCGRCRRRRGGRRRRRACRGRDRPRRHDHRRHGGRRRQRDRHPAGLEWASPSPAAARSRRRASPPRRPRRPDLERLPPPSRPRRRTA